MNAPEFNLDGLLMNAVETDPNGVIGVDTIFRFRQSEAFVHAEYSGGKIHQGYLVGIISGSKFQFRYCQLELDGTLNGGESNCELERVDDLIRIVEHFEWESRPGGGRNVIQQLERIVDGGIEES